MPKHQRFKLIARNDFASYRKGDAIEDEGDVDGILANEHRHHVIRVAAAPEPAKPAEAAKPAETAKQAEPRAMSAAYAVEAAAKK